MENISRILIFMDLDLPQNPAIIGRRENFPFYGITLACVHGSTNGTNGISTSFKILPMAPFVIPLVPMVPLVKTVGIQYFRQSTVWAKLPTLESHMIQYGVLNFKFIEITNKHRFYQGDIRK